MAEQLKSEGELIKWALGDDWQNLCPDIRRRFQKNPEIGQPLKYNGTLDELSASFWGRILGHITKPLIGGALIPYTAYNFPVDIQVYCLEGKNHVYKHRLYKLPGKKPVEFVSHMIQGKNGRLLEYVGAGLGMYLIAYAKDGNLHFKSDGYFWDIGICRIPIPAIISPGKVALAHINVSENSFKIRIDINQPLLGKMFTQAGLFYEV